MTKQHRSDNDGQVEEMVKHALENYFSVKKNGDTWKQYVVKVVTPDRILLLALLVYTAGGQVQLFKLQVNGLLEREKNVVTQQKAITAQQEQQRVLQSEQARTIQTLKQETETLMNENEKFHSLSTRLNDQIRGYVTRSEFNSVIRQQILPRLDRIEKKVP